MCGCMDYRDLADRYDEVEFNNSGRFFAEVRPRVRRTVRAAREGAIRCRDILKPKEGDYVEDFLKAVFLGNFLGSLYELSLFDGVSIKRSCESLAEKFEKRTLNKEEYNSLSSIARNFLNNGDAEVLRGLRVYSN